MKNKDNKEEKPRIPSPPKPEESDREKPDKEKPDKKPIPLVPLPTDFLSESLKTAVDQKKVNVELKELKKKIEKSSGD